MKKLIYIFVIALLALASCKPSPKTAADYNDKIMSEQKKVVQKYDELLETYDTYVASKMDNALLEFESQVDESIAKIQEVEPISGGETLKNSVLEYLDVYKNVAKNDAQELVRMYKVPENEFTGEMRVQWDTKYKEVDTRLKAADKKLLAIQSAFAQDFNLKLSK